MRRLARILQAKRKEDAKQEWRWGVVWFIKDNYNFKIKNSLRRLRQIKFITQFKEVCSTGSWNREIRRKGSMEAKSNNDWKHRNTEKGKVEIERGKWNENKNKLSQFILSKWKTEGGLHGCWTEEGRRTWYMIYDCIKTVFKYWPSRPFMGEGCCKCATMQLVYLSWKALKK